MCAEVDSREATIWPTLCAGRDSLPGEKRRMDCHIDSIISIGERHLRRTRTEYVAHITASEITTALTIR